MLRIDHYRTPETIEEAHRLVAAGATALGGLTLLKHGDRRIAVGVDLSRLGLEYIKAEGGEIRLGAMTSAREAELCGLFGPSQSAALRESLRHLVGVQFRSHVTIGGLLWSRLGHSDFLAFCLASDALVRLYGAGELSMEAFLEKRPAADIVAELVLPADAGSYAFESVRTSFSDRSLLNCAVRLAGGKTRIAVGARPAPARLAAEAMKEADRGADAARVGRAAAETLAFSGDVHAGADYRKEVCAAIVERAVERVRAQDAAEGGK